MQSEWIKRAHNVLPAGGFGNFDSVSVIEKAKGSRLWDADGNEFIDLLIGSGPMVLGHGHPEILDAVHTQLGKGMTFFANNPVGIELAEVLCEAVECAELVRFLSTGGEADMYAMRLARAFTGRDKIVKFEGGYHGMTAEAQMSLAPDKMADFPTAIPDSAGIPTAVRQDMLIAPFNDPELTHSIIEAHADEIAGVIVEPLQRIIPPDPGFLAAVRETCNRHGIVLIFDEVVTGFRLAYGGAQQHYGVVPDLCTLGKVIGGGFALSAVAGRADIMSHFDKGKVGRDGFLMQVGTLSGNPVAAIAGLKTLEILRRPGQYEKWAKAGVRVQHLISEPLTESGIAHQIVGEPSLFEVVFTDQAVRNYRDTTAGDATTASKYQQVLRSEGLFKSPNKLYVSLALTEADYDRIGDAARVATNSLLQQR